MYSRSIPIVTIANRGTRKESWTPKLIPARMNCENRTAARVDTKTLKKKSIIDTPCRGLDCPTSVWRPTTNCNHWKAVAYIRGTALENTDRSPYSGGDNTRV